MFRGIKSIFDTLRIDIASPSVWQEIAQEAQDYRDASLAHIHVPVPDIPADELGNQNVTGIPGKLLNDVQIKITEMAPRDLLDHIAVGRLSSVEVTQAFLVRAAVAQKLVNCVTEVLPTTAIERAGYLDAYLDKHKKPIGPLHGLPISVKSHIAFADLPIPCGFVGWWRTKPRPKSHAHVLQILHDAGAVFYVRTTEPQCLMHLETSSNLYGETVNPYHRALTSGGSSGGEGALLGMRGSCLGMGTDIGGSIRSPAANCGVWGYRSTALRLPDLGCESAMKGYDSIVPVLGPLSTTFEGLELFVKTVLDARPWLVDPRLWPIGWRTATEAEQKQEWFERANSDAGGAYATDNDRSKSKGKKIRIGVLWHDGIVRPHPPVSRALATLVRRLQAFSSVGLTTSTKSQPEVGSIGRKPYIDLDVEIEVVDFQPYKHDEAWHIISSLYFPDNGNEVKDVMKSTNEPWRPLTKWILDQKGVKENCISELWALNARREAYKFEYAAHWRRGGQSTTLSDTATNTFDSRLARDETSKIGIFEDQSRRTQEMSNEEEKRERRHEEVEKEEGEAIDILLTPVGPSVAPPLNHARYWNYTSQWNLLDYPAIVIPVGFVGITDNIYTFSTTDRPHTQHQNTPPTNTTPAQPVPIPIPSTSTSTSTSTSPNVNPDEEHYLSPNYQPLSPQDAENRALWHTFGGWSGFKDAPVGLQVVARRGDDEKLFAAVALLKDLIGF